MVNVLVLIFYFSENAIGIDAKKFVSSHQIYAFPLCTNTQWEQLIKVKINILNCEMSFLSSYKLIVTSYKFEI